MALRWARLGLSLIFLCPLAVHSRPGDVDVSFGSQGKFAIAFPGGADDARAIALQPDGKVLIAGTAFNGMDDDFAVVRLNADGSPDTAFGTNGRVLIPMSAGGDHAYAIALDALGRIIVAGSATHPTSPSATGNFAIARLLPSGALDSSFGGSGRRVFNVTQDSTDILYAVAVDSAGRIVAAGRSSFYEEGSSVPAGFMAVLRLTAAGALDASFGYFGLTLLRDAGSAVAIALDALDRIAVASGQHGGETRGDFAVLRLDANGDVDASFAGGAQVIIPLSYADDIVTSIAIDSQGRLVVAGHAYAGATGSDFAVARVNSDGTADTEFGSGGVVLIPVGPAGSHDFPYAVQVDANDRIVVAGATNDVTKLKHDVAIVRLLEGGALDPSFGSDGRLQLQLGSGNDIAVAVALDASGRILVAGTTFSGYAPATHHDFFALRLGAGGALDSTFGAAGKSVANVGFTNTEARAIAIQADDKIVVAGWCGGCGASNHTIVTRLNPDGSLDPGFGVQGHVVLTYSENIDRAFAVAVDAAGKILIAGLTLGGFREFAVARLHPDGSLDSSFGAAGKASVDVGQNDDEAYAMAIDALGRVVLAGRSYQKYAVIRLNAIGALDTGFAFGGKHVLSNVPPPGVSGQVNAIVIDAVGRILLGGTGAPGMIARLDADGMLDPSFGSGGVLALPAGMQVHAMTLDASGRLLATGTAQNGARFDMAAVRVDAGGTLDQTFGSNGIAFAAIPGDARAVKVDPRGRIVVAGQTFQGGELKFAVARLHSSGIADAGFGTGGYMIVSPARGGDVAYGLGLQSSGAIVVAGTSGESGSFSTLMSGARLIGNTLQRFDFTADGRSDVLWRNGSSGENYVYPMNGTTILGTEGYLRTVANPDWQIAGVGDFNGDGTADILWRNSATGENYMYFMSGTTIAAEGYIRTVLDPNWQVAGISDFDGDGKDDVLWRNGTSGENYVYFMNGLSIASEGYLRTVADTTWEIKGVSDFNGDGRSDILWRNVSTGENYVYLMNGLSIVSEGYVRTVADTAWEIKGVGDFDGDGRSDILWRNVASGENYLYLMNGASIANEGYLRTVGDPNWHIAAVGDYDGDGKADILWRNAATGENYLYPMDGTAIRPSEGYLRTVPPGDWEMVGK